jgi:hypothetical protein
MHAIERPYLPRTGVLALGAVFLAIVLLLLLAASRVGDIGLTSSSGASGASTAPPAATHSAPSAASLWLTNPFATPFHVVLPWNTPIRR